ncbi:unnamed protein product [Heligmosomoides polygyrus]|uniref:MH2 domain-containing protein n=1 Tax=Heligmosomoides polygyrus TaxID=6339 RepID=A0A3P8AAY9_HELPZ|nr:unnamed protein product [Heligmosomoides polygyrus]
MSQRTKITKRASDVPAIPGDRSQLVADKRKKDPIIEKMMFALISKLPQELAERIEEDKKERSIVDEWLPEPPSELSPSAKQRDLEEKNGQTGTRARAQGKGGAALEVALGNGPFELMAASRVRCIYQECDYPATGDETLQNAAPITGFSTSGEDYVRATWCITHCKDRKSIKAAMNFQPSNSTAPTLKVRSYRMSDGKRRVEAFTKDGRTVSQDDDNTYCVDPDVVAAADQVFQNNHDVVTIAQALNYYINKPGWAYLVYQIGQPPSMVSTMNVHMDPNFCMKTYYETINGRDMEYQMFAGLVRN